MAILLVLQLIVLGISDTVKLFIKESHLTFAFQSLLC